jgi:hypothetical protein
MPTRCGGEGQKELCEGEKLRKGREGSLGRIAIIFGSIPTLVGSRSQRIGGFLLIVSNLHLESL